MKFSDKLYILNRWLKMFLGRSIDHVNQPIGKNFINNKGYYNDFTLKITRGSVLNSDGIPMISLPYKNENIEFSIAIFQYGLGAYDLFLETNNTEMFLKAKKCADWGIENMNESGFWETFTFHNSKNSYSSMAQGEGASLLIRVYNETKIDKYLDYAKKAVYAMLTPIDDGGTAEYHQDDLFLLEDPNSTVVLNGWIFSLWGLFDLRDVMPEASQAYQKSINTLKRNLGTFDLGYWSKYNASNMICSPFYHKLHIELMSALYILEEDEVFNIYRNKWSKNLENPFFSIYAVIVKSMQKIRELKIL